MNIAILSDIHANSHALKATMNYLEKHLLTPQSYWVLGDLFGRGPYPMAVYSMIEALEPSVWLAGNHDWYTTPIDASQPNSQSKLRGPLYRTDSTTGEKQRVEGPNKDSWDVCQRHRDALPTDVLEKIGSLSGRTIHSDRIFVAHGMYCQRGRSGNEVWLEAYIDSPDSAESLYTAEDAPWRTIDATAPILHVSGHTHVPGLWRRIHQPDINGDAFTLWETIYPGRDFAFGQALDLEPGYFYHLNPGSVGMPGTNVCYPNFALLNDETYQVAFYQADDVDYSVETVRIAMQKLDYPPSLYSERQMKNCP